MPRKQPKNPRHLSKSVEHYTPPFIVEAARATMGSIQLDPCSNALANRVVRAQAYYTANGLELPWYGNVFLNPPGGKTNNASNQKIWWQKLVTEWMKGNVKQAVYVGFSIEFLQVTQSLPEEMQPLRFSLCFPKKRVAYFKPIHILGKAPDVEEGTSPPHASVLVYLHKPVRLPYFVEHFSEIGRCLGYR